MIIKIQLSKTKNEFKEWPVNRKRWISYLMSDYLSKLTPWKKYGHDIEHYVVT